MSNKQNTVLYAREFDAYAKKGEFISEADLIIRNPNHFGYVCDYIHDKYGGYGRIKKARTGKEMWRYRSGNKFYPEYIEVNRDLTDFNTIEEFRDSIHSYIESL